MFLCVLACVVQHTVSLISVQMRCGCNVVKVLECLWVSIQRHKVHFCQQHLPDRCVDKRLASQR